MRSLRTSSAILFALLVTACGDKAKPRVETLTPVAEVAPPVPAPAPVPVPEVAVAAPDAGVPQVAVAPPPASEPDPLPATFEERMKLGKKHAARGEVDEALAAFTAASAIRPADAAPHVEMARVLIADNDPASAGEQVDIALEKAPASSAAWNTKGRVLLVERQLEGAIYAFTRATQTNPANAWAWNNLGLALISAGKLDEAIEALETATGLPESEGYMFNNLGVAYERRSRVVEARSAYKQGAALGSSLARQSLIKLDEQTAMTEDGAPGIDDVH
jgi:tetratricopeptide (TPR) repeat protein